MARPKPDAPEIHATSIENAGCYICPKITGPVDRLPADALYHHFFIAADKTIGIGLANPNGPVAWGCIYDLENAKRYVDQISALIAKLEGN